MADIRIPYNWEPRKYQIPFLAYMSGGGKRATLKYHRRAGKDEVCLHWTAISAMQKVANYWHCLPEYSQARKAIWEAVNPHTGKKRIDEAFPKEIRKNTRNDEMTIEFVNGSTWRLVGSDRYDSLVGAPPYGIVFSEYALSNPAAWDYMRPMLTENGGWAIFNSTVRGRNHFWKLCEFADKSDAWFSQSLSADDSGVFTKEQLDNELAEMIALHGPEEGESRFRQEYYNDPDVALPGAYYAATIGRIKDQITTIPYDPSLPVITAWDIGYGDSTAIWFVQASGGRIHVIDYLEQNGVSIEWYAKRLREMPYSYYEAILPHDAGNGHINGSSVQSQLEAQGFRTRVLDRERVDHGIQAARSFIPRCWFDEDKTSRGLTCLREYHREWDDKLKRFKDQPKHDWTSHAADAFRYLAIGFRPPSGAVGGASTGPIRRGLKVV